jgi:hypothetical protein
MFSHVDALYLPRIAETRAQVAVAIERLLAKLDDDEALLGFLLQSCAMRIGPLQPIPTWLKAAAAAAKAAGHPEVGIELAIAADREQEHRLVLIDDLVQQRQLWYQRVSPRAIDLRALVHQRPGSAALHHAELRKAAAGIPLGMIATELELAEFGRVFGPALVDACRSKLGDDAEGCIGFVQARADDTRQRASDRLLRLEALLVQHPRQAAGWAKLAGSVIESYLEALDSCTELRVRASWFRRRSTDSSMSQSSPSSPSSR